jgi:hypothetical protein
MSQAERDSDESPPPPPLASVVTAGSHTLQSAHRKRHPTQKQNFNSLQRHSSGANVDYDNVEECAGATGSAALAASRARSNTVGDVLGKNPKHVPL